MTLAVIADLVPHAGRMCLLEEIVAWDPVRVHCRTGTHRNADHPLARSSRLPAVAAIEYAAQATAVHGGLLARKRGGDARPAAPGRLVALKNCAWTAGGLEAAVDSVLDVRAHLQLGGPAGSIYDFSVGIDECRLVTGRLTIKPEIDAV